MSSLYLQRYAWSSPLLSDYDRYLDSDMVVVIPCFKEDDITKALTSLQACTPPESKVLVVVVVNEPENASEHITKANNAAFKTVRNFNSWFSLKTIHIALPPKKAGVGLARKVGMDEAVRIFERSGKDGIIICYDADCLCDANYLRAIEKYYQNPHCRTGVVYYEHPLNGSNQEKILQYELFLRYYIDALRFAGFPHAFQTLGSCITVRSRAYQKQGGMNTRKAGEDFYFLHKMVLLGGLGEITDTRIIPSDRVSDRVPFGTGHAIGKRIESNAEPYTVYHPQSFEDIKVIFDRFDLLCQGRDLIDLALPASVTSFCQEMNFDPALEEIRNQSNNSENFRKRFFAWWDGFRVLKFVHFCRDRFYPNVPLSNALQWLASNYLFTDFEGFSTTEQLEIIRRYDREHPVYVK